jgi:hypothetical protein
MQHSPRSPSSRRPTRSPFAVTAPLVATGLAALSLIAASALGTSRAAPTTLPYSLTAAAGVKPVNLGLMMRGPNPPSRALASVVDGYIIEGHWDNLQPTAGGPLVTTVIDKAVNAVRAWNAANPTNQRGLRLRIEAGIHSPAWVKALAGGPVNVKSPSKSTGTVARWWTQPVEDAYTAFMAKLAAYTDPIPEVREVTVGATMEFFGEIFIRFPSQNTAALAAAGFTQAADIAAIESSFRAYLPFQHTTTQIDVNAYQQLSGGGSITVTQQLMNYALSIGLAHVQFANASLSTGGNTGLYALMQAYGPKGSHQASLTFQSMPRVSSVTAVITRALGYGASSLELPQNAGSVAALGPLGIALELLGGAAPSTLTPNGVTALPASSSTSAAAGVTGSAAARTSTKSTTAARLASAAAKALAFAATHLSRGSK